MKAIFELINPDNTLSVNRRLAHAVGLQEAVVYSALLAKYAWYESHGMLGEGGWFYSTAEDLEESTALTRCQQQRCIGNLTSAGLICCNVMGMPAKRYFRIVDDVSILKGLFSSVESKPEEVRRESGENEKQDPIKPESKPEENRKTIKQKKINLRKTNRTGRARRYATRSFPRSTARDSRTWLRRWSPRVSPTGLTDRTTVRKAFLPFSAGWTTTRCATSRTTYPPGSAISAT